MTHQEDNKILKTSIIISVMIVFLPWVIIAIEAGLNDRFTNLGIYPLKGVGILGIATHWLVHGDLKHLISNTFPFFISLFMLFYHYRKIAFEVLIYIALTTGFWVWMIGRDNSLHIGASGLIYGLESFIILSGILSKNKRLMAAGLILIFLHGGLIYGLIAGFFDQKISYEAHIAGFFAGILYAFWFKNKINKTPKVKIQYIAYIELQNYWLYQNNSAQNKPLLRYKYEENSASQD